MEVIFMKNNRIKKIIANIVAALMCTCSVPFYASAENNAERIHDDVLNETDISLAMQTSIPRMLWALKNKPEYLGFEVSDNAVMGELFTVADIENGILSNDTSIAYYPISSNGSVVAVLTLIKSDGEVTTTIGKDFSDKLEPVLKERRNVSLVSINNSNIVAVDNCGNTDIISSDATISDIDIQHALPEKIINDSNVADSYTISNSEVYDHTIPINSIIGLYSENIENIRKNYYTLDRPVSAEIVSRGCINFSSANIINVLPDNTLDTYDPNATAMGDYLDEYETVYQGNLPICWASTIASMLRWELPSVYSGYTGIDVCDDLGHSYTGAYDDDVDDYLTSFLTPYNNNYIPTYENTVYSQYDIGIIINNEDPVYMGCLAPSGSRHATALCGFLIYSDDTFAIRLMNPGTGSFQLSDREYSSTTFRYAYNGTYFTWVRSVRFYYQHA